MGTNYQPLQMPSMPNPVSTGLDRMVAAAREKKRQEEEAARMLLNYGQFEESKRQARVSEGFQERGEGRADQYVDFAKQDRDRQSKAQERTQALEKQARMEQIRAAFQAGKITAQQAQEMMEREGAKVYGPQSQAAPQGGSPMPDAQEFGDSVMPLPYDRNAVAQGAQAVGDFLADGRDGKPMNPGAPFTGSNFLAAMPGERQLQTLSGPGRVPPSPQPANAPPQPGPLVFQNGDERYTMETPEAVRAREAQLRQADSERVAGGFAPEDGADPEVAKLYQRAQRAVAAGLVDPKTAYTELNDQINALENNRRAMEVAKLRRRGGGGGKGAGGPGKTTVFDPETGAPIGNATDPVEARGARGRLEALSGLKGVASKLRDNYEEHGSQIFGSLVGSDAAVERDSLVSQISLAIKNAEQLGAITGPDMEMINRIIGGDFTKITGRGGAQRLEQLLGFIEQKRSTFLRSQGISAEQPDPVTRAVRANNAREAEGNKKAANVLKRGGKPQAEVDGEDDQFLSGSGF